MVKYVEGFKAEFGTDPLGNAGRFVERPVVIPHAIVSQDVLPAISEVIVRLGEVSDQVAWRIDSITQG